MNISSTDATQTLTSGTIVDGSVSEPGITFIIFEQEDETIQELNWSIIEERSLFTQSPGVEEKSDSLRVPAAETARETTTASKETLSPTVENQLEFLQYLVRRGLVNEGFAKGQEPEQYTKKK